MERHLFGADEVEAGHKHVQTLPRRGGAAAHATRWAASCTATEMLLVQGAEQVMKQWRVAANLLDYLANMKQD